MSDFFHSTAVGDDVDYDRGSPERTAIYTVPVVLLYYYTVLSEQLEGLDCSSIINSGLRGLP